MKQTDSPPPHWEGIKISVAAEQEEAVISFLIDEGLDGVEVRNPDPRRTEILAYIKEGQDIEDFVSRIQEYLKRIAELQPGLDAGEVTRFSVETADWSEKWKESFKPIKVGKRLVIAPSWEQYAAQEEEQVIIIDPGMAFGTGQHETTGLCLEALNDLLTSPPSAWTGRTINLLDVGCGTGILALAAVTLGARRAEAIDNDPVAIEIARENILQNGLQDQITAGLEPLEAIQGDFLIITANIQLNVLKTMAPWFKRLLAREGVLLLSGLLVDQQEPLLDAYPEFVTLKTRTRGEWALLELALK